MSGIGTGSAPRLDDLRVDFINQFWPKFTDKNLKASL
jgi:hypothetical protein